MEGVAQMLLTQLQLSSSIGIVCATNRCSMMSYTDGVAGWACMKQQQAPSTDSKFGEHTIYPVKSAASDCKHVVSSKSVCRLGAYV